MPAGVVTMLFAISIHAPLRERRQYVPRLENHANFNPRSLTGATAYSSWPSCTSHNFNPRSLTGATWAPPPLNVSGKDFNPRSLTGATLLRTACSPRNAFQSTLPYGSDIKPAIKKELRLHFNPRSLTGATVVAVYLLTAVTFQSTLPYGSDYYWLLPNYE